MHPGCKSQITPRIQEALDELWGLISASYPQATFVVEPGYEPCGIYLIVTVDVDDTDEVRDVYGDRILDLQVEEGLPLCVVTLRPIERVHAELVAQGKAEPIAPPPR